MPSKSLSVKVQPGILEWARNSAGLTIAKASSRLAVSEEALSDLEQGQKTPTLAQLEKLAKIYKRPLAAFLLPAPPKEKPPPKDFRSLPKETSRPLSEKTLLAIRRARRMQALARELAISSNRRVSPRIGAAQLTDDPEMLAESVRSELGIRIETQFGWKNEEEALGEWRRAIEKQGILVFQLGKMPLEDARAFSLADEQFPAIVLNSGDRTHPKIFSLFHEYAHLLLHSDGICFPATEERHLLPEAKATEVFCNRFAGAFLVAREALLSSKLVEGVAVPTDWSDETLREIAGLFKVSQEVILRRLLTLNFTTEDFYQKKRAEWEARPKPPQFRRKSRPAEQCVRENGVPYVSLVLDARRHEAVTYADLADYLGVRFKYLPRVEELVGGGH